MRWLGFERRWRDELCVAALPTARDADLAPFWEGPFESAAPALRRAVRLAVWVFTAAPLVLIRRPRSFARLRPDEKDACLVRALEHRRLFVRQLAAALRLVACMAYFSDPAVRAHVKEGSG